MTSQTTQSAQDTKRRSLTKVELSPHAWLQTKIEVQPEKAKCLNLQVLVLLLTNQCYAPSVHGPKLRSSPAVRLNLCGGIDLLSLTDMPGHSKFPPQLCAQW